MKNSLSRRKIIRNTLLTALIVLALAWSWEVTGVDMGRLVRDFGKGKLLISEFLTPDVVTREVTTTQISVAFPIPCGSATEEEPPSSGPRLVPSLKCADPRTKFTLEGFELAPNSEILVRWRFPDGRSFTATRAQSDASGHFKVDLEARPIAASANGVASSLEVDALTPVGKLKPSQALKDVLQAMFVTIFMALLSTTVASIVAAPLSFLAARNITKRGFLGTLIYNFTRSVFNILRSYDPLVMATVFGFWLSFGPFPGFLALTVVTVASLGKLFSEAVEGIDTGPMEALQATGANQFQTVVYGAIPQIVPDFVSFIIYHWDINVRISTIIGFVGGGGIGYYLSQQINSFAYSRAGTAIWAIVIIVWAMDFLSAEVRKKLT
jgi:phosphonate transport system permease protein